MIRSMMKTVSGVIALTALLLVPSLGYSEALLAVSNRDEATVSLYHPSGFTLKLVKAVATPQLPREMCLAPDGRTLYIVTDGAATDTTITAIDLEKREVAATIRTPTLIAPDGCTVSPDSKQVYVVDAKADKLFVFSAQTHELLRTVATGEQPRRALFTPDGKRLLVSNAQSDDLTVIDAATTTVIRSVHTGHEPRAMAFTRDGKYLAVSMIEDDSVNYFRADTLELDQSVGVPQSPQRIVPSPDGRFIFVLGRVQSTGFQGAVGVCDVRPNSEFRRVANTIPVGWQPWGMAASPDGSHLYVTSTGDNVVEVIDVALMRDVAKVPTGKAPFDVVFRP